MNLWMIASAFPLFTWELQVVLLPRVTVLALEIENSLWRSWGLCLENLKYNLKVLVADIIDEFILGLDIMSAYGFVVDIKKTCWKLQIRNFGCVFPAIWHCNGRPNTVKIIEANILEPGGVNEVLMEHSATMWENFCSRIFYKKLQPVHFSNPNNNWTTLQKGQIVAYCESIVKIVRMVEEVPVHHTR